MAETPVKGAAPDEDAVDPQNPLNENNQNQEQLHEDALREIFKRCSRTQYITLSRVSKQYRTLAAECLYRKLHMRFPEEDDAGPYFDDLANCLNTFANSEYNYAQHLKEFVLETKSIGDKAERAYREYHYHTSCGKFLNTLLLLTLRKAETLENFT